MAAVIPLKDFERLRDIAERYEAGAPDEHDCRDVTEAVVEGLQDVKAG